MHLPRPHQQQTNTHMQMLRRRSTAAAVAAMATVATVATHIATAASIFSIIFPEIFTWTLVGVAASESDEGGTLRQPATCNI